MASVDVRWTRAWKIDWWVLVYAAVIIDTVTILVGSNKEILIVVINIHIHMFTQWT